MLVLWTFEYLGLSLSDFVKGFSSSGSFLAGMIPPDFGSLDVTLSLAFETLVMAVVGTSLGMVLGVALAYLSAKNSLFPVYVSAPARLLIVVSRSIPDLVFAVLLVALFGIGPTAGAIALGLGSIGMVGRISTQAIEDSSGLEKEALRSAGATKIQVFFGATLPQVFPSLIALFLYRLDINFRSATLMGLVGAGGIGLLLKMTLGVLDYNGAMGVITVIFLLIFLLEGISISLRAHIQNTGASSERSFPLGWVVLAVMSGLLLAGIVGYMPNLVQSAGRLGYFGTMISGFFVPDFLSNFDLLANGILESLAIAIQGTFWGLFIGLPVGFWAARKSGFGPVGYALARSFLVIKRGFPTLVIALLFISAIGLGPLAGILAMAIGTGGALAKFIADSLEDARTGPVTALATNGSSKWHQFVSGVLPQMSPTLLGHILYSLDMNIRYAAVLGIVGGGGIGVVILTSVRIQDFGTTSAALLLIIAVLVCLEFLSSWLRRKLA